MAIRRTLLCFFIFIKAFSVRICSEFKWFLYTCKNVCACAKESWRVSFTCVLPAKKKTGSIYSGSSDHIFFMLTIENRWFWKTDNLSKTGSCQCNPPVVHGNLLIVKMQKTIESLIPQHSAACDIILHKQMG